MDTSGERIKWVLEQRRMTAAELASLLGVSRSAVSQWWRNQKPTSPHRKIEQISNILNLSAEWLRTGAGELPRKNCERPRAPARQTVVAGARLVGTAEAEAWREGLPMHELTAAADQSDAPIGPILHQNLTDIRRFAVEVRGSSANRTILPGEYAVCADFRQARPAGPQPEDLVVVTKRRGTSEHKIFVARLHYCEDTWELHYESNDPRWQQETPIRLSKDLTRDTFDDSRIEIIGCVLGAFRLNPQPLSAQCAR